MATLDDVRGAWERWIDEATRLAGGLGDLAQRAAVYHSLFQQSGRNHVFPAIAAHGALWAGRHFRFGARLGRVLAWESPFSKSARLRRRKSLERFADAFRDVNRRVCIETYASYHFVGEYGDDPLASAFVPPDHLSALRRVHAARRAGVELPDTEKRHVYETHFRGEQATVVGPMLEEACERFDWPLLKWLALRPTVRFAYLPKSEPIRFRDFASSEERIRNGLRAFDLAAHVGWDRVTTSLREYETLPEAVFVDSRDHFESLRHTVLATA